MLYMEIIAVCSQIHTKTHSLGRIQNFFNRKLGGTWCSHRALKDYLHRCAAGQLELYRGFSILIRRIICTNRHSQRGCALTQITHVFGTDRFFLTCSCCTAVLLKYLLNVWKVAVIIIIIIIIIIINVVSCHRPFLPGTSLEPAVIPIAQASSFTLQYFPYYV
jgi:uncharacterized integral membrane protein